MFRRLTFLVSFLALSLVAVAADPPLTEKQREEVLKEITDSKDFAKEVRKDERVVPASVANFSRKADKGDAVVEFAEVMHFNYKTGQTIRTLYNRTEKRVVRVEKLDAYPTPLADEEVVKAKKIAEKQSKRLAEFIKAHGADKITVEHLAPVIADRNNSLYGKRLAILYYRTKADPEKKAPVSSFRVEVNLTDEQLTEK